MFEMAAAHGLTKLTLKLTCRRTVFVAHTQTLGAFPWNKKSLFVRDDGFPSVSTCVRPGEV